MSLEIFHGILVATLVGAASPLIWNNLRPYLVFVDEAAQISDAVLMIAFAFFNPLAWILVGDPAQRRPYLTLEHDLGAGRISSNPYKEQVTYSFIQRALESGRSSPSQSTVDHMVTALYWQTRSRMIVRRRSFPHLLCGQRH